MAFASAGIDVELRKIAQEQRDLVEEQRDLVRQMARDGRRVLWLTIVLLAVAVATLVASMLLR